MNALHPLVLPWPYSAYSSEPQKISWLVELQAPATPRPYYNNERGINLVVGASGMPMASEVEGQMNLFSLQKCTKEDEVLSWQQWMLGSKNGQEPLSSQGWWEAAWLLCNWPLGFVCCVSLYWMWSNLIQWKITSTKLVLGHSSTLLTLYISLELYAGHT